VRREKKVRALTAHPLLFLAIHLLLLAIHLLLLAIHLLLLAIHVLQAHRLQSAVTPNASQDRRQM
jgi:hypothetical protein